MFGGRTPILWVMVVYCRSTQEIVQPYIKAAIIGFSECVDGVPEGNLVSRLLLLTFPTWRKGSPGRRCILKTGGCQGLGDNIGLSSGFRV